MDTIQKTTSCCEWVSITPHPTQYRSYRRRIHPGSLVHLLFSNGWPATRCQYKTVQIIFPLNLQAITITLDVVKWRWGGIGEVTNEKWLADGWLYTPTARIDETPHYICFQNDLYINCVARRWTVVQCRACTTSFLSLPPCCIYTPAHILHNAVFLSRQYPVDLQMTCWWETT